MRIAISGAHQSVVGGAETYLSWLLRMLVSRGHTVAFAFERAAKSGEQRVDQEIEPLTRLDLGKVPRVESLAALARFRPDVVFLQGASDAAFDLALAERFRTVLFAHAFYGTCATGWKVHHRPSLHLCTRTFGPACLAVNYLRGCGARSPVQLLRVYSSQNERLRVVRKLAGLVVASEYMRRVYVQNGVDAGSIRVLPPPGNLEPDATPPVARESPRQLLFLGRFTSGKGGIRAIEAAAICQGALPERRLQLTMAGDGPELGRCQRLAESLRVAVDFPGWVGPEQRMELLRRADVLVVPSLWPEPFGLVGIEAASVGVPAVAYRAGGIVDWLTSGKNGELAEGFDAPELAAALERALRDPEHHHRLQVGAWQTAHEFGGQRHVAGLESFFDELSA